MAALTRPARDGELRAFARAAIAARLVADDAELAAIRAHEPWRLRVTDGGEAVLLGRWREHLDLLAVLGIWCAVGRIPALVADLEQVAVRHGFGRLLGPLVPEDAAGPYLAAGLSVVERVLVLRLEPLPGPGAGAASPDGVAIRLARPGDLDAVCTVDADAFDDFWRYDRAALARYASLERLAVAVGDGQVIGYTLASVRGREGTLGRLAVTTAWQGHGVGRALAEDAVRAAREGGARWMTLSTQEDNASSRALYGSMGFRELPGALVATVSGPLPNDAGRGVGWFRGEGS